jgi:competence protein ComEA
MQLSRRQIYAYVAVAALVLAVGARYVVFPRSAGPAGGEPLVLTAPSPSSASSAAAFASPSAEADVVVYVCGAVKSPGVVRVPADARVADALALAGGPAARAELAAVNLAAKVVDGQQIMVPERGAAPVAASGAAASTGGAVAVPGAPVNINTASLEELDGLDGVGPATAQKIIDYRTASGPFKTIDDIKNVSGIGDAKFAAMKDSITV